MDLGPQSRDEGVHCVGLGAEGGLDEGAFIRGALLGSEGLGGGGGHGW